MASQKAMTTTGPSTSSTRASAQHSSKSFRRSTKTASSRLTCSSRKPHHKFSSLSDVVDGLSYDEYATAQMLNDHNPPFTVYSENDRQLNPENRQDAISNRMKDIMVPFNAEPWYTEIPTDLSTTGYPQALPENIDEPLGPGPAT